VKLLSGQQRSNTGSPMPGSKQYSRFDSPERETEVIIEEKSIEMHVSSESEPEPMEEGNFKFNY
jgi:hypothetical protein